MGWTLMMSMKQTFKMFTLRLVVWLEGSLLRRSLFTMWTSQSERITCLTSRLHLPKIEECGLSFVFEYYCALLQIMLKG